MKIGDKAPPLDIISWVKGEPQEYFRRGHVYILEFGFISCMPCRKSIPYLSSLSRKYEKSATIISVHVWENGVGKVDTADMDYVHRVEKFVAKLNNTIAYTVAVDGPSQKSALKYMSGINGSKLSAPKTYVIDQSGDIVWIGTPSVELDEVLGAVIKKRFNSISYSLRKEHQRKQRYELYNRIEKLKKDKLYHTAELVVDSLIDQNPGDLSVFFWKYRILIISDEKRAYKFGKWLLNGGVSDDFDWFHFMNEISSHKSSQFMHDLNLEVTDKAYKVSDLETNTALILKHKAIVYYWKKEWQKAIEQLNATIVFIKNSDIDSSTQADLIGELVIMLKEFQLEL